MSPANGGFTFACDPAHDCTRAAPIWSARVDPHVLVARATPVGGGSAPAIDLAGLQSQVVHIASCEHVRIDIGVATLRLDVVQGSLMAGPASIEPAVALGARLAQQWMAIRQLDALLAGQFIAPDHDRRLPVLVFALRVADALKSGASLREIGLSLFGGEVWPGDGDHLKSRTRRLVSLARALTLAGPAGVLGHSV
jgi:hypothetical protein